MNLINTSLLFITLISPSHTANSSIIDFCTSISDLAESTASARDNGMTKNQSKQIIKEAFTDNTEYLPMINALIDVVYKHPSIDPYDMRIISYKACINTETK
jgi:hypothetical protein